MPCNNPCSTCNQKKIKRYSVKYIDIGSKMELYIDGGIRKGSDIFKCLALGADFVFLGRGFLYSLI
jgi:glutamate synthase domain-containing protein 2